MASLSRRLLGRLLGPRIDTDLAETIAWSVDQVDPRLRQAGGHPGRYAAPVAHAWAYCQDLAQQVPGPIAVNRQSFARDPLVHALFGSADDIVQALVRSQPVREWHQDPAHGQEVFALMGVRRWEKDIFGMEDSHGVLRRDVPQKAVFFSDHTFSNLGASARDARYLLARQFMSSLLARVQDRLEDIRQARQSLEQDRDELLARLRGKPGDEGLQAELRQTLASLSEAVEALDLRAYASHFEAVLMQPEKYLSLRSLSMSLDAMGIQRPEGGNGQARQLDFQEMACRDRRRWIVMLVHCQLDELPPYQERLAAEARWLAI